MKKFFTLLAAFIASSAMMAQDWENAFPNSDCEGTDFSGFAVKPNQVNGEPSSAVMTGDGITPAVGKGVDGSQCISVFSAAGAAEDWDAQFWIMVPASKTLDVTDKFKVTFQYRCESEAFNDESFEGFSLDTQAHGEPGDYHHWSCIGSVSFPDQNWQTFEAEATVGSEWIGSTGFRSIAFNLSKIRDYDVTFYFDNVTFEFEHQEVELVPYWSSIISGGDMNAIGQEQNSFTIWENGGYRGYAIPEEGIGNEGNDGNPTGGIKVVVPAKASETWDSQFFITFNEPIAPNEILKVKFDYKASETVDTAIDTQAHASAPGSYNHYQCIGSINFTDEWKTYEYTLSVTSDMSKEDGNFQNIAFNMAVADHEVTYYFDNISVTHRIMVDPSENPEMMMLQNTIADMENKYDMTNLSAEKSNGEIRAAFEEAYQAAMDEEEDFAGARQALLDAEGAYSGSVSDYARLKGQIDYVIAKMEIVDTMGDHYADLKDELDGIQSKLTEEWENQEWTRAEINENVNTANIKAIIAKYIGENAKDGDDITVMIENPSFAGNTNGWSRDGGSKALDYGPQNRNTLTMDKDGGFLPTGMCEVWHGSYNAYQNLAGLPAGLYKLTVNAAQRADDGTEMTGVLYGTTGDQTLTQLIMSVYADGSAEQLFDTDGIMADGSENNGAWPDAYNEETGKWIPNGKGSANYHLNNGEYLNTVNILMENGGDLRIGVKDANTSNWVVLDNFKLYYYSLENVEAFAAAVRNQIARLESLKAEGLDLTEPAQDALDYGIDEAEKLLEGKYDLEQCRAMNEKLAGVYNDVTANALAMRNYKTAWDAFEMNYYNGYDETCTPAIAAEAAKIIKSNDEVLYKTYTTEQLNEYTEHVKYVTAALMIPAEVADASDENPVQLEIFGNPDFEDYAEVGPNANYPGWSGSGFGTGGGTAGPVGERWNQSNGFNTYVDFQGLPEGTYVLTCDGAYRTSLSNDVNIVAGKATTDNEAFLYATTSNETASVALHNIATGGFTEAECEALGLPTSSDIGSYNITTVTDSLFNEETQEMEYVTETVKYIVPDQLYTADLWIQAGKYTDNKVVIEVPADGKLRVGVRRKGQSNDWCFVDNFALTYLGTNSKVVPTDIETIQVVPASNAIYTIAGVRVSGMTKPGLYIVNGKKVLVK